MLGASWEFECLQLHRRTISNRRKRKPQKQFSDLWNCGTNEQQKKSLLPFLLLDLIIFWIPNSFRFMILPAGRLSFHWFEWVREILILWFHYLICFGSMWWCNKKKSEGKFDENLWIECTLRIVKNEKLLSFYRKISPPSEWFAVVRNLIKLENFHSNLLRKFTIHWVQMNFLHWGFVYGFFSLPFSFSAPSRCCWVLRSSFLIDGRRNAINYH